MSFFVATFKFVDVELFGFVETLFINSFKQNDERYTVANLTFVMSDRFHTRFFVYAAGTLFKPRSQKLKTVRNSCHLLKLLVTLESNV